MGGGIQRTDRGWRSGETHHSARYPDTVVNHVRALHDSGMGWRRIARELGLNAEWVKGICAFRFRTLVRPPLGVTA